MSKSLLEDLELVMQPKINHLMQRLVFLEQQLEHVEAHLKAPVMYNTSVAVPMNLNDIDVKTLNPWCNTCSSNINSGSLPCCNNKCPMGLYEP